MRIDSAVLIYKGTKEGLELGERERERVGTRSYCAVKSYTTVAPRYR